MRRNVLACKLKLLEIDLGGFCMDSSLSTVLNTLDIEISVGTFATLWSIGKLLPYAWSGDADVER